MTTYIKVPADVFEKMKKCGDWDTTLVVLEQETGESADIWDEDVNTDLSYQDETRAVIVGARRCQKTVITIENPMKAQ